MKLLLDTHAAIWFIAGDARLSAKARDAVQDARNASFVSAVAGYEIAYKQQRRLLEFPFIRELALMVGRARFETMGITLAHAIRAGELPGPHRDPWDRILMAQAELERCTLVTVDPVFADYGVRTLW